MIDKTLNSLQSDGLITPHNNQINSVSINCNNQTRASIHSKILKSKLSKNKPINQASFFFTDIILTLITFAIMLLIISNPKKYTLGTIEGLKLFFYSVMPGLFPFMILTTIMTELGFIEDFFSRFNKLSYKLFGTSGISFYVFFMSIISGYPIGAKIIAELYQKQIITETDAKKMSLFCTTSGPSFVIGSVGTVMFNSYKIGVLIYFSHIFSSFLLGILFNLFSKNRSHQRFERKFIPQERQNNIVSYSISKTINSLFTVGAYITIFFLIGEIFDSLKLFNILKLIISPIFAFFKIDTKYVQGLLYGILEVTRGAKTLSAFSGITSVAIATGVLSFSGLSIIFQSMAFLKQAKIKTRTFMFYKCVHSILSIFICIMLSNFVP